MTRSRKSVSLPIVGSFPCPLKNRTAAGGARPTGAEFLRALAGSELARFFHAAAACGGKACAIPAVPATVCAPDGQSIVGRLLTGGVAGDQHLQFKVGETIFLVQVTHRETTPADMGWVDHYVRLYRSPLPPIWAMNTEGAVTNDALPSHFGHRNAAASGEGWPLPTCGFGGAASRTVVNVTQIEMRPLVTVQTLKGAGADRPGWLNWSEILDVTIAILVADLVREALAKLLG